MLNKVIASILISGMAAGWPLLGQTTADEVAQLKQRVTQLEKQVQEMSQILEPFKAQQAADVRRRALREKFEKKMAQDRDKYTAEQLREANNCIRSPIRNGVPLRPLKAFRQ
jgi:DNA-binding transcriptional regulator YbjK